MTDPYYYEPMKCAEGAGLPPSDDWIMQPKLDGWRAIASITEDGVVLRTRTGKEITTVGYLNEALEAFPPGTVLDGEIISTTLKEGWNRVQTICSRTTRPHVPTADDPALVFMAFDVLIYEDVEQLRMPLDERLRVLKQAFMDAVVLGFGVIRPVPSVEPSQEKLDQWLELGLEGAVVKHLDGLYQPGRRSPLCLKFKVEFTEDCELVGFYEATPGSKYDGRAVGGVRFLRSNGYEGRAAGMDDATREDMYLNPMDYIGHVVEISHKGEQKSGAVRHPQYVRLRHPNDKPVVEVRPKRNPRPAEPTGGRMRNYGAMGAEKLLHCIKELKGGYGDAYDRCMNGGSGDPAADLEVATAAAEKKGLLPKKGVVGYDMTIRAYTGPERIKTRDTDQYMQDGSYFRLNIWGMSVMRNVMFAAGALDVEFAFPEWPERPDDEEYDDDGEPLTATAKAADAAADAIKAFAPGNGKVPAYKFGSNDGWVVTADECRALATALRKLADGSPESDKALAEAIEAEDAYTRKVFEQEVPELDDERMQGWRNEALDFADYAERAATDGEGFEVW